MDERYDVVVIGAGIGGLSAAALLAKEGLKVAVLEREDRVGGRALSIKGSEISERGADWYREVLGRHYCYLADSDPGIDEIVEERLLDGYTIDLGYHGVPVGGKGYLGRLLKHLGLQVQVNPCDTGFYYDGVFYTEPAPGNSRLDDKLYKICKEKGINYWSFNIEAFGKDEKWLDEMEKVSLWDYCDRLGLTADEVVWNAYRCTGTLFTTINNPHDISAGEMLRFGNEIMMPLLSAGEEVHVGGFAVGGIITWSEAVAGEFERSGGKLLIGTEAGRVAVEDGRVTGVDAVLPDGEEVFLAAENVVSSIPVQETFGVVDEEAFPADFVERARSLYGYGSLAPYFGLNSLPMPHEEAERLIKTPVVVPMDGMFDYDVYMCWNVQSATDPACAPEGKHLLTAYLPLTEEESRDREKVMTVVRGVTEFLERTYPGFKEAVDWALYPMCWKLEGVAKSISQAGTLKPEVKAPGLEGLYFTGDTARGFGVAMDCACSAGINCAAAIVGRVIGIE
jgi:NAD(P)-binding Rossmann-like domain/Flavin containing amine oxidoreductase